MDLMEKIVSLAKRRGFIFPGSEIYGGLANSWDYGPLGVELKNNIKQFWWKRFVHQRGDMAGIDSALIMNPKVWSASGHLKEFSDPLAECKKCHQRFRADQIQEKCPHCGGLQFSDTRRFNLLFKTFIGPIEDQSTIAYLRGELAQAIFVDFPQVVRTSRFKLPFGIAAQGRVFRNEITPGNFTFRTREFDLMELEYFIKESEWEKWFEYWLKEIHKWTADLGIKPANVRDKPLSEKELAHYSKRTVDIEYKFPFGWSELYGLAYRGDFDLKNHMKKSGADMNYADSGTLGTEEKFIPHVIEPTFGLDRSVLAVLVDAYKEEKDRVVLKLKPYLAPYQVAVFPLLANKPALVQKAREVYDFLRKDYFAVWDERGNIGKRYYSQDEIGTPFCITIDFECLENGDVTVRDRDTMKQERVGIAKLKDYFSDKFSAL